MIKETVTPAVEAAIRSAVRAISGCAVVDATTSYAHDPSGRRAPGSMVTIATVEGWSPSLHRIAMEWSVPTATPLDDPAVVITALEPRLRRQRLRSAAGLDLGRATPFGETAPSILATDHVLVDRGLATLLAVEVGAERFERHVGSALWSIHGIDHDGTSDCLAGDEWVEGRVYAQLVEAGPGWWFTGDTLTVGEDLPLALRAATVGRRLGEVAGVSPIIADRIVTRAEPADGNGTEFHVAPDLVTVATMARELHPKGKTKASVAGIQERRTQ